VSWLWKASRWIRGFESHVVHQEALLALGTDRFPLFAESKRKVNRDGHVEVAKAYYSVPPEYLGRQVWARWDVPTALV
jgi:Mu transposase, C-terminal domain